MCRLVSYPLEFDTLCGTCNWHCVVLCWTRWQYHCNELRGEEPHVMHVGPQSRGRHHLGFSQRRIDHLVWAPPFVCSGLMWSRWSARHTAGSLWGRGASCVYSVDCILPQTLVFLLKISRIFSVNLFFVQFIILLLALWFSLNQYPNANSNIAIIYVYILPKCMYTARSRFVYARVLRVSTWLGHIFSIYLVYFFFY